MIGKKADTDKWVPGERSQTAINNKGNAMRSWMYGILMLLLAPGLVAAQGADERDPWEGFNRSIFTFNDRADHYVLRPVAVGYRKVTPDPVDQSITNFFTNLGELGNFVNAVLQAKPGVALAATGRFMLNSTVGLAGLFDVAGQLELRHQQEDFGQTFAVWGADSGPYMVLPFFGPSTVRDTVGFGADLALPGPVRYIPSPEAWGVRALRIIDLRADFIPTEAAISGDKYDFVRNSYLQRREFLINDGQVQDDFVSGGDEEMLENF